MLASWGCNDSLPTLPEFVDLTVLREIDDTLLANLTQMSKVEIARRRENGHRPYIAWLKHIPVAYGWVATRSAHVGELDFSFRLPSRQLYSVLKKCGGEADSDRIATKTVGKC
jgi:hypothetical protein